MSDMNVTPQAIEAEQAVIGALLRDNGAVDWMGDLRPGHFLRHEHRTIFTEVLKQISAGASCDVISVGVALGDKIPDCLGYLNAMAQSMPSAVNIGRHADLVRDRALMRALLAATSEMSELAFKPNGRSAAEVLDFAQGKLAVLAEKRAVQEPELAMSAMLTHIGVIERRVDGDYDGIPTGFESLDERLTGGPNRGALVILGARPSMGKTALALNIATNVARDRTVLVLSLEMPKGELLDRAVSALGSVPLSSILRGDMQPREWDGFSAAQGKLQDMKLVLDDQPGLTLLDVRGKARAVKRKHGLDLLVIDYLQLMQGTNPNDSRNQQLEEISRGLKVLAKELGIVVLALSQLTRNAANKARPQLSDLRDSGAIEQDADIVMFVHRDEVDNPQTHLKGVADVFIAKNRQGRIDDVMLEYEGMYTRFHDTNRERPAAPAPAHSRRGLAKEL